MCRVSTYVYGKLVELLFPSHSSTTTQLAMRYPHHIHSVIFHVPKDITQKSRSRQDVMLPFLVLPVGPGSDQQSKNCHQSLSTCR